MNPSLRIQLEKALQERHKTLADCWYDAIAQTSFMPLDAAEVRRQLADLAEQAARLLAADLVDRQQAQEIGVALARLHCLQPETLGRTMGVLVRCFGEGLPAEQAVALQPGLAALLEGVAIGFERQTCKTILAEQEAIRGALTDTLQAAEQALRVAHDELEVRVQERTRELARANEELRNEIAERKRAEEALRESEERWRALVENAPDVILTVDREARILFLNHVAPGVTLAQHGLDGYLGKDVSEFAMLGTRDQVREAIDRVFVEGINEYFEAPARLSSGRTAWFANHLGPIKRHGQVVAALIIARDITERKQIEEMKDNLIRDVSHELRTPVAKMQMSLELLLEVLNREPIDRLKATDIGTRLYGNIQRLLQTVEAILDLSALEAGRVVYQKVRILPGDLIDETLQYMRPMAEAKGLELVARVPQDLPAVEGDLEKLSRVMINLIDNAIKFSEQGQIILSARRDGHEVEFAVSDSGCGILKESLDRVFERFYQEKPGVAGAGVGLPICKRIVEDHGGRIWAESAGRAQGATLRFTLPAMVDGR